MLNDEDLKEEALSHFQQRSDSPKSSPLINNGQADTPLLVSSPLQHHFGLMGTQCFEDSTSSEIQTPSYLALTLFLLRKEYVSTVHPKIMRGLLKE